MALLPRLWRGGQARPATPVEAFRRADRFRREGRFKEAGQLVAHGLGLEPNNVTGHLLAAYLHLAGRTLQPAKDEFRWVLARDPNHARALLGLARIALEEGDVGACRDRLVHALRFYPDFPEAQALLTALSGARRAPAAPPPRALRLDRVRLPAHGRALLVARADGEVVARQPEAADGDDGGVVMQTLRLAAAALTQMGYGALRRAIVEDTADALFARTDGTLVLAVRLARPTEISQGLLDVNRLWAGVMHEIGLATAASAAGVQAPAADAAGASERRAS